MVPTQVNLTTTKAYFSWGVTHRCVWSVIAIFTLLYRKKLFDKINIIFKQKLKKSITQY